MDPDRPIPDVPTLVIDDEADFASVNTRPTGSGGDEDPTVINGRIRELLNAFEKRAYIGYTATPFANIFIHPDQDSAGYGRDLFPRDFLVNLPVPSNHVGPTKLFGLPEDPDDEAPVAALPLVRVVADHQDHIPNVHKSDRVVRELPASLREAMRAFILTCAARAARGDGEQHNSMLIHVTRFVDVQSQVAELVGFELSDLQNRIRYGDGESPTSIVEELRGMWLGDFEPSSRDVRRLYPDLMGGCQEGPLGSRPFSSGRILPEDSDQGDQRCGQGCLGLLGPSEGMSAIAIGGDKLSRGLTLEGLSVSYYLRASRMYDTLLQMGRWFGYRPAMWTCAASTPPANCAISTVTSRWRPRNSGRSSTRWPTGA